MDHITFIFILIYFGCGCFFSFLNLHFRKDTGCRKLYGYEVALRAIFWLPWFFVWVVVGSIYGLFVFLSSEIEV